LVQEVNKPSPHLSHDDSGFCTDILSTSNEHSIVSLDAEL